MSLVVRATELVGRPVVTLDTAIDVAEVKDVVFDPDRSDLAGFTLRGRGPLGSPNAGQLAIANVAAIGRDAVMIPGEAAIQEEAASLEPAVAEQRNVVGNRVMTDAGRDVGSVVDLILRVDAEGADVAGYEVEAPDGSRSLLPIPATFSVSGETVVVPAAVESYVTDDLTGFGAAVDRFRLEHGGGPE